MSSRRRQPHPPTPPTASPLTKQPTGNQTENSTHRPSAKAEAPRALAKENSERSTAHGQAHFYYYQMKPKGGKLQSGKIFRCE